MRLRIAKLLILLFVSTVAEAQIAVSNPLEWMALAEGNELINDQIDGQVQGQLKTAALQSTIAAEFTKIKEWEGKYSNYLQAVDGFASTLRASCTLYEDGLRIIITLGQLKNAIADNPQGIAATMSMNNLFIETATELISVFTILRDAIDKGGKENMLTGAERSSILWALSDRLGEFSKRLHRLYLSIRYYTMLDVWHDITAGMLDRDNGTIARQAKRRWIRGARISTN